MAAEPSRRWTDWGWLLALAVATVPFLPGLTGTGIFYLRDLSIAFWGRHLFFRRTVLSGEFPLWDPYAAAGQSAAADALRQMFLLPSVIVRLIGSDVLSFNLWVATPYPLAAVGAWLFFRLRFSAGSATLAAIAFAVSGPVVSTGNFPNMSWSVAATPWVFWAADRLMAAPDRRKVAALALAISCQALAGEPVTLVATLGLLTVFVAMVPPSTGGATRARVRAAGAYVLACSLGLALAAVQLLPLRAAARASERVVPAAVEGQFWSLHPVALLETVSPHLFGYYYTANHLGETPWLPLLNSGRDPFLLSIYFGVPLLTLALFGLVISLPSRWGLFWGVAAAASLVGAFGSYTPVYPFLVELVPVLASFRFPAKYLVFCSLVVAAGVAAGWHALAEGAAVGPSPAGYGAPSRMRGPGAAKMVAAGALVVGLLSAGAAAACMYFPQPTAFRIYELARSLGMADPVRAVEYVFATVPRQASLVLVLSAVAAALILLAASARTEARTARLVLGTLIVVDLLVRAWGINPAFDRVYLAEPAWLAYVRADPNARIYIGARQRGTLVGDDLDSSGPLRNPPGLVGSASRAVLNGTLNFEPSGWRVREMLSYDLPILFPRVVAEAASRFFASEREARDRFLDRTGVRYRVLPPLQAGARQPLVRLPYFYESYLYDWGDGVLPRVSVVSDAEIVPDVQRQVQALFEPGWDARARVLVTREPSPAGVPGEASPPSAAIDSEGPNRVNVRATAGDAGGYLLMLDTYTDDWHATVDGQPADLVRANGLFRAVRLAPGSHRVEFVYRPRAFHAGLALSAAALLVIVGLCTVGRHSSS